MKRDIYIKLQQWKNAAADRKPLILKGARQVGKTYILKFFGQQEYENTVYLNFEEDPGLHSFFKNRLNPRPIIERLSIYLETKILPEKTLLIFDEIQNCPEALNSLKYFKEEAPDIHLAAAGSLLGIKVGKPTPFPVGKVTFMDMYPLTFFEFLDSLDRSKLRQFLENKNDFTPIETALHDQLIELLRSYYFIGGMPEVINQYIQTKDFAKVRNVQNDIITAYANDFAKHSSKSEAVKISRVWQTLSAQLAKENKKFQFSEISDRARSREYADAVQWLCDGGLVHKCYNIKVPKLPLSAYREENIFKLYLLDIGLLSAWLKLTPKTMIQGNRLFSEYNGVFVENYTAQELMARNIHELHYWTSSSTAEVDFILPFEEQILPLEVKAGLSKKKKSLKVYADKFKPPFLIRTSLMNFKQDDHICNYPLYGLGLFSAGLPSYEKKDRADHFTPSAG